jgi:hypothetical protein
MEGTTLLMEPASANISDKSWRTHPEYHIQGRSISAGTINLSPGFLTQNGVRHLFLRSLSSIPWSSSEFGTFAQTMHVSRDMSGQNMTAHTFEWMQRTSVPNALLNMVLMLIHPDQYTQCVLARRATMTDPHLIGRDARISEWPSILTGTSIIANRVTPAHRDEKGHPAGFDLMTSFGDPERARIMFPDWGASLDYGPGTVVAASTRIVTHQVDHWGDGNRICMVHWMRRHVLSRVPDMPGATPWATRRGTLATMRDVARTTGLSLLD